MPAAHRDLFSLDGTVAVITGGTGVLGRAMARALARAGARVGVLGRREARAEAVVSEIEQAGGEAAVLVADVLDRPSLEHARDLVLARWDRLDILVNAAGGNTAESRVTDDVSLFDLPREALEQVVDLNLLGTLLSCQAFGEVMAAHGRGCIVNISSMAADRALTGVIGYGIAKAGVENLTRWLATELARRYGPEMRVNAIAPGFFVAEQNRALLLAPDGTLTERGRTIVERTPAGRFGEPDDLIGTLIWLCSPGAGFVNGVVVPVDGGFSAFSGV